MLFKKIILSPDQEQAYYRFMLKYEINSLKIVCFVGIVHTILFLTIDYWRVDHFLYTALHRTAMGLVLVGVALVLYKSTLTVWRYNFLCILTGTAILILSFSMDLTARTLSFFLPNFICLLFYAFNAGLGHPLKFKSIQTGIFLLCFVLYSVYFSEHKNFHLSQSWNLLVNATISLLIAFLIERYKRLNFVQREELVNARRKIEELNNLKTRLISVLSHDLSSPLNSLKGLLQLKKDNLLSAQELDHHSEKVKKSLENALDMLQNLVRWSSTQLEGFKSIKEKIDLQKTIAEVIESVEITASMKKITILNQIKNTGQLILDPEILKLVARNFLTNSIKFSHPGSFVVITSNVQADSFTLSVQDTGIGMSQEDLKKLFVPKKLSRMGTQNENGSGIGLVITKEFAEMMNGTISVKSEEGKGSTFSATFPLHL